MSGAPRVLVAPDKFKGSATAAEVSAALARGVGRVRPDVDVTLLPVADGGDGTLAAALAGGWDRVDVTATGPTGGQVTTGYARRGTTAVVEMADACGLERLPERRLDAEGSSSRGLGDVVRAALDAGCREIVLGIGGSASTDGGTGFLAALGLRALDARGDEVVTGGKLASITGIDTSRRHPALAATRFTVACDVDNPLVGARGAAAVFGPQKGAGTAAVRQLDGGLVHWADVVGGETGHDHRAAPGAGAAGGVGFAAIALLDAELRPGIDLVLDLVGFDDHLDGAALVVTGEGSLDDQSLHGKAPVGVSRRAATAGVRTVAVCGRCALTAEALRGAGIEAAYALLDVEPDVERCIAEPLPLLERTGASIARDHLA
ncbi:glycerate kinase [Nocardioides aestuarii]|uniref:Glycerate kinase n=1 Tax=Nocardioides aestuarii TaxID=252231 RepID=A0ABW4TLL2_9ACTN